MPTQTKRKYFAFKENDRFLESLDELQESFVGMNSVDILRLAVSKLVQEQREKKEKEFFSNPKIEAQLREMILDWEKNKNNPDYVLSWEEVQQNLEAELKD